VVWTTVVPDVKDLPIFLETGKSPKYDPERILGRWTFNVGASMGLFRRTKPNISSTDMQKWKKWMVMVFAKTSFVAMTDHQAILKNAPQLKLPAAGATASGGPQTLKGEWKDLDTKYQLALSGGSKEELLTATIEGDRLTISADGLGLAFDRED
jgi:muramidase (phage lysozyme)